MSEDLKDSSLGLIVNGYDLIPNKPLLYRIALYSADIVESILNSNPDILESWLRKLQEEYSTIKKRCDLDQDPSACYNLGFYEEFQKNFTEVSPEEIFQMVTVNPARALRYENALGQIRPGFGADFIAVPCSTSTDVFEQILAFDGPVNWAMVDGNIQHAHKE